MRDLLRIAVAFLAMPFFLATTPSQYSSWRISGSAANALVSAYAASGLDGKTPAPFALQSYVVSIRQRGAYFEVIFQASTTRDEHDVFVNGATSAVTQSIPDAPDEGLVLLPGIVAGSLIAGYREAINDRLSDYLLQHLRSGAYNLGFEPYAGGTTIAFVPLSGVPAQLSTEPAPTPTPNPEMRCLAGNCDRRLVYYVTVREGRVQVQYRAIL
jgi:hypothetical protein